MIYPKPISFKNGLSLLIIPKLYLFILFWISKNSSFSFLNLDFLQIFFHIHGKSKLSFILSKVIFGFSDRQSQSHGRSKFSRIKSIVIFLFTDIQYQSHGLSKLSLIKSIVIFGFSDILFPIPRFI